MSFWGVFINGFRNWLILYSFCCFPNHFGQFNQHLRFQCGFNFDSCIFKWVELILVGIQRWKIEWNPWNYLSSFRMTWCGFRFKPWIHLTRVRLKFWCSFGFWFFFSFMVSFEHEQTANIAVISALKIPVTVWNIYFYFVILLNTCLLFLSHQYLTYVLTES